MIWVVGKVCKCFCYKSNCFLYEGCNKAEFFLAYNN